MTSNVNESHIEVLSDTVKLRHRLGKVERWTGLVDSYGTDIYEGDTLHVDGQDTVFTGIVTYMAHAGYPAFEVVDDTGAIYDSQYNVFTNPTMRFEVLSDVDAETKN